MSRQEQRQIQSEQTVEQQELKFMVQQDFLNVIGIAQDVQETINFYKDDPNHQMVQVQMNRLILQLNLSNGIHVDLNQTSNNRSFLVGQKKQVGSKLNNMMEKHEFDDRIKGYLDKYKNQNLCENPFIKQEKQIEVKVKANFDQSVVQKVIGGMREVDNEMSEIQSGKKTQELTNEQIEKYLEKRSQNAKTLLKKNKKENNKEESQLKKQNSKDQSPKPLKQSQQNEGQPQQQKQPKDHDRWICRCIIQ